MKANKRGLVPPGREAFCTFTRMESGGALQDGPALAGSGGGGHLPVTPVTGFRATNPTQVSPLWVGRSEQVGLPGLQSSTGLHAPSPELACGVPAWPQT